MNNILRCSIIGLIGFSSLSFAAAEPHPQPMEVDSSGHDLAKEAWRTAYAGNYTQASYLLHQAAEQGHMFSCRYLAHSYKHGGFLTGKCEDEQLHFKQLADKQEPKLSSDISAKILRKNEHLRIYDYALDHPWLMQLKDALQITMKTDALYRHKNYHFPYPGLGLCRLLNYYAINHLDSHYLPWLKQGVSEVNSETVYQKIVELMREQQKTITPEKKRVLTSILTDNGRDQELKDLGLIIPFRHENEVVERLHDNYHCVQLYKGKLFGFIKYDASSIIEGKKASFRFYVCNASDGSFQWISSFTFCKKNPYVVHGNCVYCADDENNIIIVDSNSGEIITTIASVTNGENIKNMHINGNNQLYLICRNTMKIIDLDHYDRERKIWPVIAKTFPQHADIGSHCFIDGSLCVRADNLGDIAMIDEHGKVKNFALGPLKDFWMGGTNGILIYLDGKNKYLTFVDIITSHIITYYNVPALKHVPILSKQGDKMFLITSNALLCLDLRSIPEIGLTISWNSYVEEYMWIEDIMESPDGSQIYCIDSEGHLMSFDANNGNKTDLGIITSNRLIGFDHEKVYAWQFTH